MGLKEQEIRPEGILEEYLRLAQKELSHFFPPQGRNRHACPACKTQGNPAIEKDGFTYEECPYCHTLYVSPRPSADQFSDFYRQSQAAVYWATHFYPKTEAVRREKLWKPKARLLSEILRQHKAEHYSVVDIGGGYGVFAEEYTITTGHPVTVIEPSPHLAKACREKNIHVVEAFLEDLSQHLLPSGPRVFTSFELFEHLHSPEAFMTKLRLLMEPGDFFIFSTLSSNGVDIRILWENSQAVSPPHHLNFFNPRSIRILLERCRLETIQVTTPGELDLDILQNNRKHVTDRFWQVFLAIATEEERSVMQNAISQSGFSSHMLTVARCPD